jgi:hypothetical protein
MPISAGRANAGHLPGHSVEVVAYPFSNQNSLVRCAARDIGYRCAVRGKAA